MLKLTEQPSHHRHLEKKSVAELTALINNEDKTVSLAIENALPEINKLITAIVEKLKNGGRLFYVGAGCGGRLSVLDQIEIPNTYGVEKGLFNVVLAGGVEHLVEGLEEKEDDITDGWMQLASQNVSSEDIVVGISASGTTPFVLAALKECRKNNIVTGCIVNNSKSPIGEVVDLPVELITGPEFVTGSTRMKCGTAQKMLFDMISTTTMIQLGRVEDNSMVNVKLINDKVVDRAVKMLMQKTGVENYDDAKTKLLYHGSVKKAMEALSNTESIQ